MGIFKTSVETSSLNWLSAD